MDIEERKRHHLASNWNDYLLEKKVVPSKARAARVPAVGDVLTYHNGGSSAVVLYLGGEMALVLEKLDGVFNVGDATWFSGNGGRRDCAVLVQGHDEASRRPAEFVKLCAAHDQVPFAAGQRRTGRVYFTYNWGSVWNDQSTFTLTHPSEYWPGYWDTREGSTIHPDWPSVVDTEATVAPAMKVTPTAKPATSAHDFSDRYATVKSCGDLLQLCVGCGQARGAVDDDTCKPRDWRKTHEEDIRDTMVSQDARRMTASGPRTRTVTAPFRQSHPLTAGGVFSLREQPEHVVTILEE